MEDVRNNIKTTVNRRSVVKNGLTAAGVATAATGFLASGPSILAQDRDDSGHFTRGDAALLRFAAAAEILETDLWVQYNELAGIPDDEVPGGSGNPAYTAAVAMLDSIS